MHRPPLSTRLALAVPALALALSGCLYQDPDANDNGPQPQPEQPTGVVQAPVAESPQPS